MENLSLMCKVKKKKIWSFPGSPVVKSSPCNTGNTGSIPGWGAGISHAAEQLNPHAATVEPKRHN